MATRSRFPAEVLDLVGRPYVLEILAELERRPATLDALRAGCRASRAATVAAVRTLAAHGVLRRDDASGSWDTTAPDQVKYGLAPAGRALVASLWDLESWSAAYGQPATEP
ncbi:winged helix-turn-helix transcriptional regulator [Longispora sp. K20-0274]|uniref:winged helix-turn-helix transcriptional regulator n=1 Tax=Longispora sp. K20-0274 TaxID=3088255 RepID=UPI0039998886